MKNLPLKLKIFLTFTYIFTAVSIIFVIQSNLISVQLPHYIDFIFFIVFFALSESFIVIYKSIAVSASFAVQVAALILFRPIAAIIIIAVGFSLRVVKDKNNNRYVHIGNTPFFKTMFNYCALILPMLYSGIIYEKLGGSFDVHSVWNKINLILLFSIIYFLINTFLNSLLFSLLTKKSIFYFFISNAKLGLLSSIAMAPFGILLAFVFDKYKFAGILIILVPILIARYTFYLYIQAKTQYVQTVDTLMHAIEARDNYTEGHSQRVAEIATMIARELKYREIQIERIHMASLLHDVGKIGINDGILNKPGKLTKEEYETIQKHPEIGYNILKDLTYLKDILPIVRNHHERYDGKGYPDGKHSDELELDVFIVQLADTIDAMATDRPYRKALSEQDIIEEITKFSGTQFHPKVVEAYKEILRKQKKAV